MLGGQASPARDAARFCLPQDSAGCCGARTCVDAQQGVNELLGGTLGAVVGLRGHQAVPGPAGL